MRGLPALVGLCLLATGFSAGCGPVEAEKPTIEISGLKPVYCKGDLLKIAVQNEGDRAISVNVAIESIKNGKWTETWASLRTPAQEIPTRIPSTDLVQPHTSITYSFDILALPVRPDLASARHRLRVDSVMNMTRKSVTTSEFAVCSIK